MAQKADADRVAADIRPPEYRKAVQLMRHDISKKKARISGINGEIADVWGKIEGHKVTKPAGRIFMSLDAMEEDERIETLRCLQGLIDAAAWPEPSADLADIASGTRVENRVGGSKADEEDDGEEEEEGEEEEDPSDGPAKSKANAISRARGHLGGGMPDAMGSGKPLN